MREGGREGGREVGATEIERKVHENCRIYLFSMLACVIIKDLYIGDDFFEDKKKRTKRDGKMKSHGKRAAEFGA